MAILRKNQMDYMRTKLDRQEKVEEMEALLSRTQGVNGEQEYNPLFSSSAPRYGNGLTSLILNAVSNPLSTNHYNNRDNLFGKSSSKGLLGSLFEGLNSKTYGSQNNPTLNDLSRGLLFNLAQQNKQNTNNANRLDFSLSLSDLATQRENKRNKSDYERLLYGNTQRALTESIAKASQVAGVGDWVSEKWGKSKNVFNLGKKDVPYQEKEAEFYKIFAEKTGKQPRHQGNATSPNTRKLISDIYDTLEEYKLLSEGGEKLAKQISKSRNTTRQLYKKATDGTLKLKDKSINQHDLKTVLGAIHSNHFTTCSTAPECSNVWWDVHEFLKVLEKE